MGVRLEEGAMNTLPFVNTLYYRRKIIFSEMQFFGMYNKIIVRIYYHNMQTGENKNYINSMINYVCVPNSKGTYLCTYRQKSIIIE